jgi:hypothetical protein
MAQMWAVAPKGKKLSLDNSVGIGTSCTSRVRFPAVLHFPLLHNVQTKSESPPASYHMCTMGSFAGVKAAEA